MRVAKLVVDEGEGEKEAEGHGGGVAVEEEGAVAGEDGVHGFIVAGDGGLSLCEAGEAMR